MDNQNSLGPIIRKRREAMRLSQRELAEQIGVKASHVAYCETSQRRPSLGLAKRLSDVLGIDPLEMLLLSHPESKALLNGHAKKAEPWSEFAKIAGDRYGATAAELRYLKKLKSLGSVPSASRYELVLQAIRVAVS